MDQYQSRCTSLDLGLGRKEEVAVVDKLLLGGKKLREVGRRVLTADMVNGTRRVNTKLDLDRGEKGYLYN
jgi:hypothetical protein